MNKKLKEMEDMYHHKKVELDAQIVKLAGKEEELKQSQNDLKNTREQVLKYIEQIKKLREVRYN